MPLARGLLAACVAALLAGCAAQAGPTPAAPVTAPPGAPRTPSPEAAAAPKLVVTLDGRHYDLAGYDPAWPPELALDRQDILRLAPHARLERGRTYDITLRFTGLDTILGWLPPDFGLAGGSLPVRTDDGFVPDVPSSAFVRADALPDFEAGMFGVKVATADGGSRIWAFPMWIDLPDVIAQREFAGLRMGIADADGSAASATFLRHVGDDLRRGGAAPPQVFASADELRAAFDAGKLDDWISIPAGWGARPTTQNGFESGTRDPVTGNGATDTGNSYVLSSLIVRALGPDGIVADRGL